MNVRFFLAAFKELLLRVLFLHKPKYLYHYSKLQAVNINTGFIFKVNTQGRMYALDLDFGHTTVSKKNISSVVVFSGKAIGKFVCHNPLYFFGYKLFWGHLITPRMGDVRFVSVKHHGNGLVEVDDFEVIGSLPTSNSNQVFKVLGIRLLYCLALLSGPASATAMIYFVASPFFVGVFYESIDQLQYFLWLAFGCGFGLSIYSWRREYLNFSYFRYYLDAAGLVSKLPLIYRAFIVFWAWTASGVWASAVFLFLFVPWVWLMNWCCF